MIRTPESAAGLQLNGDADLNDMVAQLLDASGPANVLTSLGVAAIDIAISDEIVAVVVPEEAQGSVDRNGDGNADDGVLAVHTIGTAPPAVNVGLAASRLIASGSDVVFLRPEAAERFNASGCTKSGSQCDLNGDGDALDEVVHVYHAATGETENLGLAAGNLLDALVAVEHAEIASKGRLVVIAVREDGEGADLNGDADLLDSVLHVLDLDTGRVLSTGVAGFPCVFVVCAPGQHYKFDPVRRTLSFIVVETFDGHDLDLDGDQGDILLNVFNLTSGRGQYIKLSDNDDAGLPESPALPDDVFGGATALRSFVETDFGLDLNGDGMITSDVLYFLAGDADGDGVFDDFDTCRETANPGERDYDADLLGDESCDPVVPVCPVSVQAGCRQAGAGASSLKIKDSADDPKDSLKWKWSKGAATTIDEFGDPVSGSPEYSLCVYDGSATPPLESHLIPAGGTCNGAPCWRAAGTKGFRYKDKLGLADGITGISLKSGVSGKAKISAGGRGSLLTPATAPLSTPVVVQLFARNGAEQTCWEADYASPTQNTSGKFAAKRP